MAFLRINGHEVPISDCDEKQLEIGSRRNAYSGKQMLERRNILRQWEGTTNQVPEDEAIALIGEIQGVGHVIPMSDADPSGTTPFTTGATDTDQLYSHDGLAPADSDCDHILGVAADGKASYDENGISDKKYYDLGVMCAPAATNLLPDAERDAEGDPATDYTAFGGATLSNDTTNYYRGTKSVQVDAGGQLKGVRTSAVAVSSGDVTCSARVYDATGQTYTFRVVGDSSGVIGGSSKVSVSGSWKLFTFSGSCAAENVYFEIYRSTSQTAAFSVDDFQLENTAYRTPWVDGSRSSAGGLKYPVSFNQRLSGITFMCWAKSSAIVGSEYAGGTLCRFRESAASNNRVEFRRLSDNIILQAKGTTGSSLVTSTGVFADNDWHHLVARYVVGTPEISIYVDGSESGTAVSPSGTQIPDVTLIDEVQVGGLSSSTFYHYGQISDVIILPYAATADQIAAIYGMGQAMSPLPEYYIDGDLMMNPAMTVKAMGEVTGAKFVDGVADEDDGYQVNLREISMKIREQPK